MNPGNALMGCALAIDSVPEAAAVPPLVTGDRVSFIGLPEVGTILAMLSSRGL